MTLLEQNTNQAPRPGNGCLTLIIKVLSGIGFNRATNPADSASDTQATGSTVERQPVVRRPISPEGTRLANELRFAIGRRASNDLNQE